MLHTLKHSKLIYDVIVFGIVFIIYHMLLNLGVVPNSIQDMVNVILGILDVFFRIILTGLHLVLSCLLNILQ